mgnify:CR=1 FL=1
MAKQIKWLKVGTKHSNQSKLLKKALIQVKKLNNSSERHLCKILLITITHFEFY